MMPNKPVRIYDIESFVKWINPSDWIVQPKWNGHRALPTCDRNGKIVVLSRHMTPLTMAKNHWEWLTMLPLPWPWQLDGEMTWYGRLIVWDYYKLGKRSAGTAYIDRLSLLETCLKPLKHGAYKVELVETRRVLEYSKLLTGDNIEGLVFKRKDATDFWGTRTKEVASMVKFRK